MAWTTDPFPKPTCSVKNCSEPIRSKGLCRIHYQRMYVQGRTERVKQTRDGPCLVDNCDKPVKGLGYCNQHYQLFKRNGKPEKLVKKAREHPLYVSWFEKKQNKLLCEEWLIFKTFCEEVGDRPDGNFVLRRIDKTAPYGPNNFEWYEQLKKEEDEPNKEWWARKWADARARNPDKEYERNLLRNYGINLVEYFELYDAQNGVCYICKQPELSKRLAVDHCHKSIEMKIRKLLCWRCNTVLGKVEENTETLKEMINYIEQHKEN